MVADRGGCEKGPFKIIHLSICSGQAWFILLRLLFNRLLSPSPVTARSVDGVRIVSRNREIAVRGTTLPDLDTSRHRETRLRTLVWQARIKGSLNLTLLGLHFREFRTCLCLDLAVGARPPSDIQVHLERHVEKRNTVKKQRNPFRT